MANQIMIAGTLSGICEAFTYICKSAGTAGIDLNVLSQVLDNCKTLVENGLGTWKLRG